MAAREDLLRQWLTVVVEESTLEELAARSIGARMRDADLVIDVVAGSEREEAPLRAALALVGEIDRLIAAFNATGVPFGLAIVSGVDRDLEQALAAASGPRDRVIPAGNGEVTVLFEGADRACAALAVERLCDTAAGLLGGRDLLPPAGTASCPQDGEEAHELLTAARRPAAGEPEHPAADELGPPPANVTPLRPL